jgi:lysophospholipase L1-like esterase
MTFRTIALLFAVVISPCLFAQELPAKWETCETHGKPHPRHEAAFVGIGGKFYLLGGRRIQPVDLYDPATKTWTQGTPPPVEVHHFQPVIWEGKIWLVGAMTGQYPHESALDHIPIYDPVADTWSRGPSLPADRRRGGAGAVVHGGKLYVVCGIINGHWDGNVSWLDVYDFKTGLWSQLPDAPHARDHFQAAVIGDTIYAAGGRRTSGATNEVFNLVVPEVDGFDVKSGKWTTTPTPLPTPRAGTASINLTGKLVIAGGETGTQPLAHSEVERYDPGSGKWDALPSLARGRHGSGLILDRGALYIASGSGARGGAPELDSLERLSVPIPHDFKRWESAVAAFAKADAATPPPKNPVLFVGASSIVRWQSLATDFPGVELLNRGFGGNEIVDSTHYADQIIFPYAPKIIFLRAGGNDIHMGHSPAKVFGDFKDFVAKVRTKLPEVPIAYIALSPSPARWHEREAGDALNAMIADYVKSEKNLLFVDASKISLGPDGQALPELFVGDQLHFSAAGYQLMAEAVRPFLPK